MIIIYKLRLNLFLNFLLRLIFYNIIKIFQLKNSNQAALGINDCLCLSVFEIGAKSGLETVLRLYLWLTTSQTNLLHR